jgi:glycosyltransferase involved in cell wall biosynthesis
LVKVLVAVKFLGLDRASEGICSAKFLYSLVNAGLEVVCLAPAQSIIPEALRCHGQWVKELKVLPVGNSSSKTSGGSLAGGASPGPGHGMGRFLKRKLGTLVAYGTGFAPETWAEIELWKRMLRTAIASERPDLVFARGAASTFEPHLAMARLRTKVPWIANYHDPFPASLYSEPYRQHFFLMSPLQEKWNAGIIRAADRISFPSHRSLRWMLRGKLAPYREKGVVIPHIAGALPLALEYQTAGNAVLESNHFVVLHAGSLLGPRQPWALIDAFRRFVAKDPAHANKAELLFVGGINRHHKADPRWAEALRTPGVRFIEERVTYAHSLALVRQSAVSIVLEANGEESPFFPAKLADCLFLQKPILALSPAESVVADILGTDYRYRCLPSDSARIGAALEELWCLWQGGRLAQAAIPPDRVELFSMKTVGENCKKLFAGLLENRQGEVPDLRSCQC